MNQSTETRNEPLRFAFIEARWHDRIVDQARIGFLDELARRTNGAAVTDVFDAPGAFEIPLLAQRLARSGLYDGVIGAAFVVDGGIYRHEFVAETVVAGLMQAQLATEVPIFSVVLTPHHFQETAAHEAFFAEHFVLKGGEAARAALATVALGATLPKAA
ncbi:6,7-dimethyl-8-ribityllumazine synthase [Pikeienuella piscinae]|uniref:6,7-dimethyl-8-ribityllumazine synthase n=1 Tax=Pikeienuella piscinae TaxID=2748098 RepID=A0A7L5BU50_9RHOB|nr:6,7-dimethyl-8-ribityllumazine synthase [Pikeienuella piscinae]QIE55740.1 6,7-dimethyl-8-ribityllumazine synthase [Pikeienuella piscinae]